MMKHHFVDEADVDDSEGEEKKQSAEERKDDLDRKRSLDEPSEPPSKAQRTSDHEEDWVILEHMNEHPETINSERVKSHLQKYRSKKERSKQEFMEEYDSWIQKAVTLQGLRGSDGSNFMTPPPFAALEVMGKDKVAAGGLAAFLSYSVMMEGDNDGGESGNSALPPDFLRRGSSEFAKYFEGARIPFPELTQEEKSSALGISMSYVMGLFFFMSQHLYEERQRIEESRGDEKQQLIQRSTSFVHHEAARHDSPVHEYSDMSASHDMPASNSINEGSAGIRGNAPQRNGTPIPRSLYVQRSEQPEDERGFTSWFQPFPPLVPTHHRIFQQHDHPFPIVHDPLAHNPFANMAFQHAPQLSAPPYVPPYMMLTYGDPLSAWAAQTFRNHGPS